MKKYLAIIVFFLFALTIGYSQKCEGPLTVTMTGASSSLPITIEEESSGVYCTESSEGTINITVYGGTPEYDYNWAHQDSNQNFLIDLPVGSYFVTVSDANGCSEERTITIVNIDPLTDSLELVDQTACGNCYLNDGTQSFFYFEDEYIGAIVDINTDKDLGATVMCAEISDGPCYCHGEVALCRQWCFETDSIEDANVRLFFSNEELREMAINAGFANEIIMINSGSCYLKAFEIDHYDCEVDFAFRYIEHPHFSITRFDEENGVWSVEVPGLDDACIKMLTRGAALPVDFLSFDGEILVKVNRLDWATANESNNLGFVIEKSKDGISFDSIGFVKSNNEIESSYIFDDENPWTGSNFYRLKQLDLDGNFKYSHIVHLIRKTDFDFRVIENPFRDRLYVEVATNVVIDANITIFAVDGRIIKIQEIHLKEGIKEIDFDMSDQPSGNYMVRFYNKTSNEFLTKKIVKI